MNWDQLAAIIHDMTPAQRQEQIPALLSGREDPNDENADLDTSFAVVGVQFVDTPDGKRPFIDLDNEEVCI